MGFQQAGWPCSASSGVWGRAGISKNGPGVRLLKGSGAVACNQSGMWPGPPTIPTFLVAVLRRIHRHMYLIWYCRCMIPAHALGYSSVMHAQ